MPDTDLSAAWMVLETEAAATTEGIHVVSAGTHVLAGDVLVGVDHLGRRHVLIPLRDGEAFADDRRGRAVHIVRLELRGGSYLSAVCLDSDLDEVFAQFADELLADIVADASPARAAIRTLDRWRRLFSDAEPTGLLSEPQIIGLLAELLVLEEVLASDEARRLDCWTGPHGSEHDFRRGAHAVEVKATLLREGRVVPISSVDQLDPPVDGSLHLVHHRFEPDPAGDTLPAAVGRVLGTGVPPKELESKLQKVGYRTAEADHYNERAYRLVDRRTYDTDSTAFPRVIPGSFPAGTVPPGVLRLSYSIDLTNEPPSPLTDPQRVGVFQRLAGQV